MRPSYPASDFFDEGLDLTNPALYARAKGGAAVLPDLAFRSAVFAALEDERVWTPSWVCVGTEADVPETGDLLSFTIGAQAIHVQRGGDGSLAARYNKAQHGGCRFVPLQCQTGSKTHCSFTCCAYSRDRPTIKRASLTETTRETYQYIGLRPERLPPAPLARLATLLFINLDPNLDPTDARAQGLEHVLADFAWLDCRDTVPRHEQWHEVNANWKLLAQLLSSGRMVAEGTDGEWRQCMSTLADGTTLDAVWLFPNLIGLRTPAWTCFIVLQPTAVEKTLCRISVFAGDEPDLAPCLSLLQARGRHAAAAQARLKAGGSQSLPTQPAVHTSASYLARQIARRVLTPHPGYRPAAAALSHSALA